MFKKNIKYLLVFMIVLSILEVFISSTLTIAKYSDSIAVLCGEDSSNSCNTVQNSEFSNIINLKNNEEKTTFQVPITLVGILFYLILTGLLLLDYRNLKNKKRSIKLNKWLFYFAIFGIVFSVGYTLVQAIIIKAFCKYCLISAGNTIILSILILILHNQKK